MKHLTIRFDLHEVVLVSDALRLLAEDAATAPVDKHKAAQMRRLIETELNGGTTDDSMA